jgi:hypothetical protein
MINQILEMFQQFGPARATPVEMRWQAVFPSATTEELCQWRVYCEEVEAFALELVARVHDKQLDRVTALHELSVKFPDLTPRRIADAYNAAMYFAFH